MTFDPGAVMVAVEEGTGKIEAAASLHAEAIQNHAIAEAAYDEAFEAQVLRIYHAAKRDGERMPAEDVRKAIAHEKMDDGVYAAWLMAKANLAATDKQLKAVLASVSAHQSVLKALQ